MMFVRGIAQVQELVLSSGIDHMISGIAGLGHFMLSVGFIWIFLSLSNEVSKKINIYKYFMVFYSSCYD